MLAGNEQGYPPAGWPAAEMLRRDLATPTQHPTARRTTFASCPISSQWMSHWSNKGWNQYEQIHLNCHCTVGYDTDTWRHDSVNARVCTHVQHRSAKLEVKNSSDNYVYVCWGGLWSRSYESGCGDVDWNQMVQDRDQWRILVNTEIWNISAFINGSKYFAHCPLFALFQMKLTRCILLPSIFISTSLHVSGNYVSIIRRTYCIYATLVYFTLYGWLSGLLQQIRQ